jgi:hypothetical protein
MNAILHLRIAGVLLGLLVILNIFVPRRFKWREELANVSLLNRQIFQVHALFIIVILAMFAALLLTCARQIAEPTPLARAILVGLTAFWTLRLFVQFFVYDSALWRGKRFETVMHILFSLLWTYFVAVFGTTLCQSLAASSR